MTLQKVLLILMVALLFEAAGVAFIGRGLKQMRIPEPFSLKAVPGLIRSALTNAPLLTGIAMEAVFFGLLLVLLSRAEVSFVWPLTSLGLLLTTLAARFILHEQVSLTRWLGVVLIVAGSMLVIQSERKDSAPPGTPQPGPPGATLENTPAGVRTLG